MTRVVEMPHIATWLLHIDYVNGVRSLVRISHQDDDECPETHFTPDVADIDTFLLMYRHAKDGIPCRHNAACTVGCEAYEILA